jgi:hypothetical protein
VTPWQRRLQAALVALSVLLLSALTVWSQQQLLRNQYIKTVQERRHYDVLEGRAPNPWQYRILAEWVSEGFLRAARALDVQAPELWAFLGLRFLQQCALFPLALLYYRRLGIDTRGGLVGIAMLAWGMSHSISNSDLSFNTYFDVTFYLLGGLLILAERWAWLLPLTLVGSFNRETIGLLPLLAAWPVAARGRRGWSAVPLRTLAACLAVYTAVFFGIRLHFGWRPYDWGWEVGGPTYAMNLFDTRTLGLLAATLSILPLLMLLRWRELPAVLRGFFWILVPAWLLIHFGLARMKETRLLLVPLALVFVPAALAPKTEEQESFSKPSTAP